MIRHAAHDLWKWPSKCPVGCNKLLLCFHRERNKQYTELCRNKAAYDKYVDRWMQTAHEALKNKHVQCDRVDLVDAGKTCICSSFVNFPLNLLHKQTTYNDIIWLHIFKQCSCWNYVMMLTASIFFCLTCINADIPVIDQCRDTVPLFTMYFYISSCNTKLILII